jgi:antirestriction protein ArdC
MPAGLVDALLPPARHPGEARRPERSLAAMPMSERQSLYGDVTSRIIAELEAGRLPWVQPWDSAKCPCTMPANAVSQRPYSGINVLILWSAAIEQGFASQRWLTFRQAMAAGGNVRRGEKGTVV